MRVRLRTHGGQGVWAPILLLAIAAACAMPAAPADGWRPLFLGVDHAALESPDPRPLRAHVLRIDLDAPGVAFMATPGAAVEGGHTYGRKTTTLLRQYGLQAAVNAAPFSPVVSVEGWPHSISGLTMCAAEVVSPPSGLPALLIGCDNTVVFAEPPFEIRDTCTAVAGFAIILRAGANVGRDDALHPRTAAACSQDGRTLYLMVVDGRQPGYSEGVTTRELADWLLCLGAWDGLNLDGGGTSAMAVEGPDGEPRLLNRPIHAGIPGTERPGPSHLGLWAPRLPDRMGTGGMGGDGAHAN